MRCMLGPILLVSPLPKTQKHKDWQESAVGEILGSLAGEGHSTRSVSSDYCELALGCRSHRLPSNYENS
jgi:hypothetical protein